MGGGAAGLASAFFSKFFDRENDKKVLLFEGLPEDKYSTYHQMCGGCVNKKTFDEISPIKPKYSVEDIDTIKEFVVDEFVIENKLEGYILDRPKFFSYILKKFRSQGGDFRREMVIDISRKGKKIKLKTNEDRVISTKYLIGADGTNSKIREKFDFGTIRKTPAIQYIIDEEPDHGTLKIFYDEKYEGDYKWEFPNGSTKKVGFPYIKEKEFKVEGDILKKQKRMIGHGGIEKPVDGNILLVGDAAGQTNSLSKGGLRAAMFAGKEAAKSIVKYEDPEKYEKAWKKSIFHSKLTNKAFEKLKEMDNDEIIEHLKPFKHNDIFAFMKIIFSSKYRKYLDLYKAYRAEKKMGW